MNIIEAIIFSCGDCKTVSLQNGVCVNCEKSLQIDVFTNKLRTEQEDKILNLCVEWYKEGEDITMQSLWYEIGVLIESETPTPLRR